MLVPACFPFSDWLKSPGLCRSRSVSLAPEAVLVEDGGVGGVIHRHAGARAASPEAGGAHGRGPLQRHEAVTMETAGAGARGRHGVQHLGES